MSARETAMDPAHLAWCRMHFDMLKEGGVWGIPRSGLMFRKEAGKLVLFAEMPWMPEMEGTITPEELREQQDEEFEANRRHFGAVGIDVIRAEEVYRDA